MAKLSARGSTILLRMSRERPITDSDLIDWERKTIALRSDGHLLVKRDVNFKAEMFNPSGRKHSYGWKDKGKVPWTLEEMKSGYLAKGFSLEKS